jgi:formylglycine-generating enzyme required for sulfatase activity
MPDQWGGEVKLPVTAVCGEDARKFCELASELAGLPPAYGKDGVVDLASAGYRLPTEAEWECAARAGTETRWSFGEEEERLGEFAWFGGNSGGELHPVGTKSANPWGLRDAHGLVWEWCEDGYGSNVYVDRLSTVVINPVGPETRRGRVVRGGSFDLDAEDARSAIRSWDSPTARAWIQGFRCVRGTPPQP